MNSVASIHDHPMSRVAIPGGASVAFPAPTNAKLSAVQRNKGRHHHLVIHNPLWVMAIALWSFLAIATAIIALG
jgi:hypothetical protein